MGSESEVDSVQSPTNDERSPGASPPADGSPLKQGAVVGNRFVIDEQVHADVHGILYRAVDEKTGKTIAILMLDPAVVGDRGVTERLRAAVKTATEVRHKNLLGVFGMGKEGAHRYVARDFVDGQTLADLLDKKASAGKQFTLKGAYNLVAHVCNGLQYGRGQMDHGTLRPSVVLINRLGRVKLADYGFAELRGAFVARRDQLNRWDRPCFPDAEGVAVDDLHALGVMLYALLVGAPPETVDVAAEARARLPESLAAAVARCLVGAEQRFADPNELKVELMQAIEAARGSERSGVGPSPAAMAGEDDAADEDAADEDDDDEMEVRPVAGSPPDAPAPPPSAASAAPPGPAPAAGDGKAAGGKRGKKAKAGGFVIPDLGPGGGGEDDGTTQRWLMEQDGIDYGPFTGKQIVEKLFKEEITASTVIFDIETDRRLPLSEIDLFEDALMAWVHEKDKREKRRVEEAEQAAARRRTRIVLGTILFLLVTVGGGFGGWFFYQSTLPTPVKANFAGLVSVMRVGLPPVSLPEQLPETAAEIRERLEKEQAERLAKASAAERARIAREEQLAAASNLDATGGGGSGRFDRGAFDQVIGGRQGNMVRCLQDEVRRNPRLKSLTVEITVIPTGELINVKMPGASGRGESCVRGALRGLRVPAFAGSNVKVKLPFQFE